MELTEFIMNRTALDQIYWVDHSFTDYTVFEAEEGDIKFVCQNGTFYAYKNTIEIARLQILQWEEMVEAIKDSIERKKVLLDEFLAMCD